VVDKWALQVAATLWALAGFAVAAPSLAVVDGTSLLLVGVASFVFPLCALLAGLAVARDRFRAAGLLLLLSVATPTYFAWILNVPALLVGLALLLAPRLTVRTVPPPLSQA
jgi:hypothetical protein